MIARLMRAAAALTLCLVGCATSSAPAVTPTAVALRIAADPATFPLMQALTQAYTRRAPNVDFTLLSVSTASAIESARTRQAGLAAVSQLPDDGLWTSDLAMDGIAVIVNPANPLSDIGALELRNVYAGAVSAWDTLGAGGLGDIQVAVREDGDTARRVFDRSIMGDVVLTPGAAILSSVDVMVNFVAYQPNAIGYVPSSRLASTATPLVKTLRIDGKAPASRAIADGAYPMSRMLSLVAAGEPHGELRDFVAWALSAEGQRLVSAANYVSVLQAPQ